MESLSTDRVTLTVGGQSATKSRVMDVVRNPASRRAFAEAPAADGADLDRAGAAAPVVFPERLKLLAASRLSCFGQENGLPEILEDTRPKAVCVPKAAAA